MARMDEATLKALIASRRGTSSVTSAQSDATSRREALRFYRGDPLGNEEAGMSQVVSRDTMEAIESMLPGLLRPFVSGDETVEFDPPGPDDEEAAKQATEYVNYLFHSKNRGFKLLYDGMKDGLMFRLGVWKAVWDTSDKVTAEDYEGIDEPQLALLEQMPGVKVTNIVQAQDTGLYAAHIVRTETVGQVCVTVVPPDEFEYERQLAGMDQGTFFGHRCRRTIADLIEMGLPKAKCLTLTDDDDGSYISGSERADRFRDEGGWTGSEGSVDDLSRYVWIAERYILCDYDGDGAVEWRRVFQGGSNETILSNEECDGHPFASWTPIPITHKLVGMSVHDEVRDIQLVKTGIMREVQNGIYLANRPQRAVMEGQVNIDDLLVPKIGGLVRMKAGAPVDAVRNLSQPFDLGGSMSLIEYWDGVRESRTGSTRYNQGQDANSLNKTATGISLISNASHAREELMSRQFAEGLMDLFKRILKLVIRHQDKAAVIRLRGKWVEMDPTKWSDGYDTNVKVGLGTGDKQQQVANLQNLIGLDANIVQLQGGVQGPILTAANVYEKLKRLVEAMGLKGDKYYTDPDAEPEGPQQPEQPDPQPEAAQQAQAAEEAKAKAKADVDKTIAENHARVTIAREAAASAERIARQNNIVKLMLAGLKEAQAAAALSADDGDGPDGETDPADAMQDASEPVATGPAPEPVDMGPYDGGAFDQEGLPQPMGGMGGEMMLPPEPMADDGAGALA